ncbi:MAG: flagellar hook basal-body protein [Planctomycetota bacterium]|nr:flagellar hook basal-body protein [Planctomycetota bacterium]
MSTGLYDAVASMSAAEKRLDMISQNIANASARGFKRQVGAVHSFERMVDGEQRRGQVLRTQVDFRQGELVQTGNATDLALMGDGFFSFEMGQELGYSRDGALRITDQGDLVTKEGFPIVWEDRTAQVDANGTEVRVDHAGNVFQDNTRIGALRIVDFVDRSQLQMADDGFFHAPDGIAEEAATAEVHSGYYEAANTDPVHEMVEMIMAQRAYESASNTVSQIADSYRRLTQQR